MEPVQHLFENLHSYTDNEFIESVKNYLRPIVQMHIESGTIYNFPISSATNKRITRLHTAIFTEFNQVSWNTRYRLTNDGIANNLSIELGLGYETPEEEDIFDSDDENNSPRCINYM